MNQVGGPVIAVKDLTASERQHIIRGWKRDEYIKLAPGYFIEREQYEDLSREDQITARIVAHACSAETTVVVGPSAAHLWQMPVAADNETLARQPVNLASTTMRPRKTTRVRYRKIGRPHEGCVVELSTDFGTVRVTDQLTTALDLARWATLDDAVRALDDGLQQETFTVDGIADRLGEMNRVVGVDKMREAVRLASPGSESPRETDVKLLLWRMGLPAPWQQAVISSRRGVEIARADFFYPALSLVIEYDGEGKYHDPDNGQATKAKEYDQDRTYRMNGIVVLHICDETLRNGTAQELIEQHMVALAGSGQPYPEHLWTAQCLAWVA